MTSRKAKYALLLIGVLVLFFSATAKASNPIVTEPTDFWFEYTEPTVFIAQTFMVDGYPSDPQLWLYDEQGTLLVTNDDYQSLQSFISIEIQPGRYRLRAGTCCFQPDVWRRWGDWNVQYELNFNGNPVATTTTTELSTTTTIEPWTTTTTMNTLPPTTEPSTTSSPILSSTTTTQPDPPTTTSTSLQPTTTLPSLTIPVSLSPSTVSSSSTSLPRQIPTSTLSSTTTLTTIPTSTSTVVSETSLSVPTAIETTTSTSIALIQETTNQNGKTYTRKIGIGPLQITLTATEEQRRTVVAVAIVQIATVATLSATGVSTTASTNGRRR